MRLLVEAVYIEAQTCSFIVDYIDPSKVSSCELMHGIPMDYTKYPGNGRQILDPIRGQKERKKERKKEREGKKERKRI